VTPPEIDEEVPRFWRDLGLPGLADVHTHFLPAHMMRRVWAYFDEPGPLVGVPWPIRYKWPEEGRVRHLHDLGVRMFTALAYAHRPGMATALNQWTLEFASRTSGCLPSATFYPEPGVLASVRSAVDAGARVFKLHLQVADFHPADPLLDGVWDLLAEADLPVVVHAGSGPVAHGHTGPEPIGEVLVRHPQVRAVVAHLGAPEYEGFLELAERYERVMLDTTMMFTDFFDRESPYPRRALPRLRDLGLAGKVLLGSDFPNIPYPYAAQLAGLARLDFGDAWLRAVCWESAAALFKL
jgi:predicted TIM-barrel fold metal-dependent hydrolase